MPDNNVLVVDPVNIAPARDARGRRVKLHDKVRKEIKLLGAVWNKDEKVWRAPGLFADRIRALIEADVPEVEPIDPEIERLHEVVNTALNALHTAEADLDDVRADVVNRKLGTKFKAHGLTFGGECLYSPTGGCVFDDEEDRGHDNCLFCDEPKDRG